MSLEVETSGEIRIVLLTGTLNTGNTPQLQQLLTDLMTQGTTRIVLDVTELFYICSLGIGVIARARGELNERQGCLVMASPRPDIRKLMSMLRLDRIIPMAETRDEALKLCQ